MQSTRWTNKLGIIGPSSLLFSEEITITHEADVQTPYGCPSAALSFVEIAETECVLLPRKGAANPSQIPFRANIWALRDAGVERIIALDEVLALNDTWRAGDIVVAHQLMDFSSGREPVFSAETMASQSVLDFVQPFDEDLRQRLITHLNQSDATVRTAACIGVINGPRTPTLSESQSYQRTGVEAISFVTMPEAVLARALGIPYAGISLVTRGLSHSPKGEHITAGTEQLKKVVRSVIEGELVV